MSILININLFDFDVEDTDTLVVEFNPETPINWKNANPDVSNNWILDVEKLEIRKTKCDWCSVVKYLKINCICKEVWYCSETCKTRDTTYHEDRCRKRFELEQSKLSDFNPKSRKGLVGLQNLGNTCFMNTSLQCIANCYELSKYFLSDSYKKDINEDNPIGTQGVLAHSYANLLKNLYYGESSTFVPRNFKKAIATFQSMFTGFQQHDTQEFLNFLLDGLHEDLNRVLKKPFVEKDESRKDDKIKAKEQWIGHLRRNQSVLVELLYGQYKSTINCPCSNISTTFDPYLSISLPLANRIQPYEISCFFIFYDLSITPIHLNLLFNTKTTIMALRNKIAKIMNINPMSFLVVKMDSKGSIDTICNSRIGFATPSNYLHSNQKAYFLFQINPELFNNNSKFVDLKKDCNTNFSDMIGYLNENNDTNVKIFEGDYEEDEKDVSNETVNYYSTSNHYNRITQEKAVIKYSNDENYGFDDSHLIFQALMYGEDKDHVRRKCRLIFPRLLIIKKTFNLKEIYHLFFDYFFPIISRKHNEEETNNSQLFDSLFKEISEEKQLTGTKVPFKIFLNTFYHEKERHNVFNGELMMQSEGYHYLEFSDEIYLDYLLSKIPNNSEGKPLDNTFLFLNENKKYYSNMNNRDAYFLILWNSEYHEDIKKLNDKNDYDFKISKKMKNSIDLEECFKQFCKDEQLEEGNEWYCASCKNHTKARVHMEIYSTPPVLIIHLKRFRNRNKIDTLVDFPLKDLDMNKYIIGDTKDKTNLYDLFAVAHHYGGLGGGHYVASAKNPFDGKWYNFNDSSVSEERSESDIVSSSAYVLFYKRKDIVNLNLEEIFNRKYVDYEQAK